MNRSMFTERWESPTVGPSGHFSILGLLNDREGERRILGSLDVSFLVFSDGWDCTWDDMVDIEWLC